MEKKFEKRVWLNFCVSNGITATESLKMLQKCFGESTLSSCPSTSVNDDNIEKVKKIVLESRRVGMREVAEALNISYGSTQHIVVHVLGMKRIAARQR